MTDQPSLWTTADRSRWFLVSEGKPLPAGTTLIHKLCGGQALVDPAWLVPFEVTEDQARRIAKHQLGQTLEQLKDGIDETLAGLRRQLAESNRTPVNAHTTVTPDAAPALLHLLKKLPGVIANSLAQDGARVQSAQATMADLQRQLKEAGIDLDQRFTDFPQRLAALRADFQRQRTRAKQPPRQSPPGKE